MQFEPDYSDEAPTTLEQVLTQPNSVVFPTWGDGGPVTLVVPRALLTPINTNAKWVQNAGQSGTADFNDRNTLGVFRFGSVGAVSPALAGTIEVNYQLVLRSPQNHPIYNNFGHWSNLITTGDESAYLTNPTLIGGQMQANGVSLSGTTITFPSGFAGAYMVCMSFASSSAMGAMVTPAATASGGISMHQAWYNTESGRTSYATSAAGLSWVNVNYMTDFHSDGTAGTLDMHAVGTLAGSTRMSIYILKISDITHPAGLAKIAVIPAIQTFIARSHAPVSDADYELLRCCHKILQQVDKDSLESKHSDPCDSLDQYFSVMKTQLSFYQITGLSPLFESLHSTICTALSARKKATKDSEDWKMVRSVIQ